jgi:hypothetical protein
VYPIIVARQRLGKNVTVATNTQATIEELLDASLSMLSVSYLRKVGDQFFPILLVFIIHINKTDVIPPEHFYPKKEKLKP